MSERLEIRISEPKKQLLRDAAGLLGITVTRFIMKICTNEAKKVVARRSCILECDGKQLDMFEGYKE